LLQRGTLPAAKTHENDIASFTVTLPMPLAWSRLEPVLQKICEDYSEQLLRMKGIIHAADLPAPVAIHAVHRTFYPPTLLKGWHEEPPVSRVVLIGEGLDEEAIRKTLMRV